MALTRIKAGGSGGGRTQSDVIAERGLDASDRQGDTVAAWWEVQRGDAWADVDPVTAARLVVEAVRSWPAANPVAKLLGGPDWWV